MYTSPGLPILPPCPALATSPPHFRFFWPFMDTCLGCFCFILCIYVHVLLLTLNSNILTTFWGAHKLPGTQKGDVLASAVGTWPLKCIQIFIHASLFIYNISHIADMQRGCPVVPYCNPQLAAVEAALPPRPDQALITDLEALDKPQKQSDQAQIMVRPDTPGSPKSNDRL